MGRPNCTRIAPAIAARNSSGTSNQNDQSSAVAVRSHNASRPVRRANSWVISGNASTAQRCDKKPIRASCHCPPSAETPAPTSGNAISGASEAVNPSMLLSNSLMPDLAPRAIRNKPRKITNKTPR